MGTYVPCLSTPRSLHGNLKGRMFRVFAPPNQAYRVCSSFIASRQGKKELSNYVQELRTLLAVIQLNLLAEEVKGTIFLIFMEAFKLGR